MLDGLFPLELPTPCKVNIQTSSASTVALDIDIPEPTVLPTNEAKLLANGKVSYKDKPESACANSISASSRARRSDMRPR